MDENSEKNSKYLIVHIPCDVIAVTGSVVVAVSASVAAVVNCGLTVQTTIHANIAHSPPSSQPSDKCIGCRTKWPKRTLTAINNKFSPRGRRDDMPPPRRWQFDSRRIYVRPRTGPQSTHLWWPVSYRQPACLNPRLGQTDRQTDRRTDRGIA